MANEKIPVSFDIFKKYTFHEEMVEFMLKIKSNGERRIYESLINDEEYKERALRSYYEAFYLRPVIREKYHIRFKPMPRKIKEMLLEIPSVHDTGKIKGPKANDKTNNINECPVQVAIVDTLNMTVLNSKEFINNLGNCNKIKRADKIILNSANDDDMEVEDDYEPVRSPDCSTSSKQTTVQTLKMQNNYEPVATVSSEELHLNKIASIRLKDNKNNQNKTSYEMQQKDIDNEKVKTTDSTVAGNEGKEQITQELCNTAEKTEKVYKCVLPYSHCCPVTFSEFCNYTNVTEIFNGFCQERYYSLKKLPYILHRVYLIYYLAPTNRGLEPFKNIKILDHCPQYLKNKMFEIPTNLYLKDEMSTKPSEQEILDKEKMEVVKEQHNNALTQVETVPKNNQLHIVDALNNANQQLVSFNPTIEPASLSNSSVSEKDTNVTKQQISPDISKHASLKINFPVTLDEFKRHTHYKDIVDKLFKAKAQDNKELYDKYKNSKEAFNSTLNNYYQAFYLLPAIREILPIRLKSLPKSLKSYLLQIPEGVNITLFNNFKIDQLVTTEFDIPNVCNEGAKTTNSTVAANKRNAAINTNTTSLSATDFAVIPIKTETDASKCSDLNNKSSSPNNSKVINSSSTDRQKKLITQELCDTAKKTKKVYNDILPYSHCCPVTFSEFCNYTNVKEIFNGFCQMRYNSLKKLPYMLHRVYLVYYLAPNNRKLEPFKNIKLLDTCPQYLKNKMFEIPTNLYLKDELTEKPREQEIIDQDKMDVVEETYNNALAEVKAVPNHNQLNITNALNIANQQKLVASNPTIKPAPLSENNDTKHQINPDISSLQVINILVTLDEFKKHTHFKEIVDKLFKIKARDNKKLYDKYKNSEEAFDSTLNNYYQAFYLLPAIREILPIRLKSLPKSLKSYLLQIPEGVNATLLNNFKIDQLVTTEFENPNVCNEGAKPKDSTVAANEENNVINSQTDFTTVTIESKKDVAVSLDRNKKSNSPGSSGGVKRSNSENISSTSPKRLKTQITKDIGDNADNTTKAYKEVLPYAHCCPVTFSEFIKYTNIKKLFTAYCQNRYKSLKKLPSMLYRAYLLYYLVPGYRKLKPFNNLKILDECPRLLKNKMLEIPTNLYLKGESHKKTVEPQSNVQSPINTDVVEEPKNDELNSQQVGAVGQLQIAKNKIEILENLKLPHIPFSLFSLNSNISSQCPNTNCIFHHVTHLDFIQQTNIKDILPQPYDISAIQTMFKKFVFNLVKQQTCDDIYFVKSSLMCKIFKYQEICKNCDGNTLDSTIATRAIDRELFSTEQNETAKARSDIRMEITTETATAEEEELSTEQPINDKSSSPNRTASLNRITESQVATPKTSSLDVIKHLKKEKIFQKFCSELIVKLNKTFEKSVDFASDCYEIFLQCNEIPLHQLLSDYCDHNEDIVQRILDNKELRTVLQRYFYINYLTNAPFASKYPTKMKKETLVDKNNKNTKNTVQETIVETAKNVPASVAEKSKSNISTNEKQISPKSANAPEVSPKNNNSLEKAKRIFFRQVQKNNTLSYVLCTSYGLKQLILRTVLDITFEEFLQLTTVYEGKELYEDKHVAECMYRYVFRTPLIWPTNLYMTLKSLCDLLHSKNIRFDDYPTMLAHISPKLLHWSVLLSCTNIVECVVNDYDKRTGKLLDTNNIRNLKQECIEYYDRCWKHDKWLGKIPRVNEEFYMHYLNSSCQGDVTIFPENELQKIAKKSETTTSTITAENNDIATTSNIHNDLQDSLLTSGSNGKSIYCEPDVNPEITATMHDSLNSDGSFKEFSYVILPNTQQQLEMLPADINVTNDPLNNADSKLNSSSTSENCEFIFLDEPAARTSVVKTEPNNKQLLSNLIFYEDDNSNIQCTPCDEEIVNLDDSKLTNLENLPPPQVEFNEAITQLKLFDDFLNSNSSSSIMNLGQCLPSSSESNDEIASIQKFIQQQGNIERASFQLQPMQLPNVSLRSSGDVECSHQNVSECATVSVQNSTIYPEAQRLPSTFEDSQTLRGSLVGAEQQSNTLQQELVATKTTTVDNLNVTPDEVIVSSLIPLQYIFNAQPKTVSPAITTAQYTFNASLPPRTNPLKSNATVKSQQNIVKVKPLQKSEFVPQIIHTTRPLQTKSAYSTRSGHTNQALQNITENSQTTLNTLQETPVIARLAPTENSTNSSEHIEVNLNAQFQLSPLGTHIHISQELNKNCSVFNNSSLLRIADHNYFRTASPEEVAGAAETLSNQPRQEPQHLRAASNTNQHQPKRKVTRRNTMSTEINSQAPKRAAKRVTRSSSIYQNTNDKVNNIPSTSHTNNRIATIAPAIHYHYCDNILRKLSMYRHVQKFHFFKELRAQHISKYLLPTLEIGNFYLEATVSCEHFTTRISNASMLAIFPYWPEKLKRDFVLVLRDLKEFHYLAFKRDVMQQQEDLRARILYWLLNTTPSFGLTYFIHEYYNTEFTRCEKVHNGNNPSYRRKPFKCLTNAISSKVLNKIKVLKSMN